MNIKKPEILAPAGDFNSAIHALNSGADAVYLGLTSFSARKKAKNFTLDELRRLKTFSTQNDKKIYVAINTLLKDSELEDVYPIIKELELININAVIVQDLGLAKIIKEQTNLILHASTQLAIHNIHGIKVLKEIGFSRAVLSRELSLTEIKKIKEYAPEMELEIFIHGALCYGFSGLCLASSKLLGRSANRGECGQICRTWFNNNGKKEYCFSLNDLSLKDKILKLKELGIESLKIEGRMKGPGYAAITSKLYYEILNGINFTETLKESEIEFNRSGHDAYLEITKGQQNINLDYPGHQGRKIGEILSRTKNNFIITTTESLENRDGLMIFDKKTPPEPFRFAVNIQDKKGDRYTLKGDIPEYFQPTVYKLSQHDRHLKEVKPQSYKPWKSDIDSKITIYNKSIKITTDNNEFEYPLELEEAKTPMDLKQIFNNSFYPGGESIFHFSVIEVINSSDFKYPFIPGSKIKNIRNSYQLDYINSLPKNSLVKLDPINIPFKTYIKNSAALPFVTDFDSIKIEELSKYEGKVLLPLAPVVFNSEKYLKELNSYLVENKSINFILGLNNLSHLSFIKKLPKDLEYYCDYGLYVLNNYSLSFFKKYIPNLLWVTKWIEEDKDSDYPPVFISRTCFKAQQGGCPENCPKKFEFIINQNGQQKVLVRDCISYTLMDSF